MMEQVITIRPAVAPDVETLVDLNIRLCRETEGRKLDHETVTKGVRRFVSESDRGRYFAALIGSGKFFGNLAHSISQETVT